MNKKCSCLRSFFLKPLNCLSSLTFYNDTESTTSLGSSSDKTTTIFYNDTKSTTTMCFSLSLETSLPLTIHPTCFSSSSCETEIKNPNILALEEEE